MTEQRYLIIEEMNKIKGKKIFETKVVYRGEGDLTNWKQKIAPIADLYRITTISLDALPYPCIWISNNMANKSNQYYLSINEDGRRNNSDFLPVKIPFDNNTRSFLERLLSTPIQQSSKPEQGDKQ